MPVFLLTINPMSHTEIELKFSLTEQNLKTFRDWLDKNAEFKKGILHNEIYLNNPAQSFRFTDSEGYIDALDCLRIRSTQEGDTVCFKHFHEDPENPGHTTHCDEYEYSVSSGKIALKMFEALGYTENASMQKLRKIYSYKHFEIVIDDIQNLGLFIEIEVKKVLNNPQEGKQEIVNLLKKIGITKIRLHRNGYITMIINDGYDFGVDEKIN